VVGALGGRLVAIQQSLLIEAPASFTASFWSNFEQFPSFMEEVASVDVSPDGRMTWRRCGADGSSSVEVTVVDSVDGRALRWQYREGAERSAAVTFAPLAGDATWLTYTLEYEPGASDGGEVSCVAERVGRELRTARDMVEARFLESRSPVSPVSR